SRGCGSGLGTVLRILPGGLVEAPESVAERAVVLPTCGSSSTPDSSQHTPAPTIRRLRPRPTLGNTASAGTTTAPRTPSLTLFEISVHSLRESHPALRPALPS